MVSDKSFLGKLGFAPAEAKSRHPKILVFGASGSGKTWFALGAGDRDNPAIVLDTERGTHFYGPQTGHHFVRRDTQDVKAALDVARTLQKDGGDNAIILDSGTILYETTQEAVARAQGVEELKFQHWRFVKTPYKRLYSALMGLARPVIITAHEGTEYDMKRGELIATGFKPKFENGADYVFDLVLRLVADRGNRKAIAYKSRLPGLPTGTEIPDPTFQKIVDAGYGATAPVDDSYHDYDKSVDAAAEQFDKSGDMKVTLDDVLDKFSTAKAVPHLDNIKRKYAPVIKAGGERGVAAAQAAYEMAKKRLSGNGGQ